MNENYGNNETDIGRGADSGDRAQELSDYYERQARRFGTLAGGSASS